MRNRSIVVTESDARLLRALLAARAEKSKRDQEHLKELSSELERALVLESGQVPADVITMRTRVRVLDLTSGERREFVLVFPMDADLAANRISVLAPLGTALLGYREGDEVEWVMPGGLRRLLVERVFQPAETTAAATPEPFSATALGVSTH